MVWGAWWVGPNRPFCKTSAQVKVNTHAEPPLGLTWGFFLTSWKQCVQIVSLQHWLLWSCAVAIVCVRAEILWFTIMKTNKQKCFVYLNFKQTNEIFCCHTDIHWLQPWVLVMVFSSPITLTPRYRHPDLYSQDVVDVCPSRWKAIQQRDIHDNHVSIYIYPPLCFNECTRW